MFKKFVVSCFLLVSIFSAGNINASAAIIDSEPGYISYGQQTATTSRVTLTSGKKLVAESITHGGTIHFRIFKNGVAYADFVPTSSSFSRVISGATAGEYSLRAYCGNADNRKTNCAANFKIYVKD